MRQDNRERLKISAELLKGMGRGIKKKHGSKIHTKRKRKKIGGYKIKGKKPKKASKR